ncbi:MAG: hypothetical protein LBG88_02305 [Christensenellaceae bacterium]|jgi:uncharacterized membrane protein|nr:hypothetical protein [Christensenellaceae bacterium]
MLKYVYTIILAIIGYSYFLLTIPMLKIQALNKALFKNSDMFLYGWFGFVAVALLLQLCIDFKKRGR